MNLRGVDLNLLVVLQALLKERHVSRAAERLNMSQPATSRALQRLRSMFDDPLLVRTPDGYDLSVRAGSLLPRLNEILKQTGSLISEPGFDPATSSQLLKFYALEAEVIQFLPDLFQRLRKHAPNMSLQVFSNPMDQFEALENGEVHFTISTFEPSSSASQLRSLGVGRLSFAVLMSADNPLAKGDLTTESFIQAAHGSVSLTGRGRSLLEQKLIVMGYLSQGAQLRTPLKLTNFGTIGPMCEHSDVIFVLPRQIAEEIAKGRNIVIKEAPAELDLDGIEMRLYWHERHHKDPMCRWVRQQFKVDLVQ